MRNQGIGSWPARRARKTPHRVALLHEDRAWTYADLHERVARLAHGLRALGVRRGDRVAYLGANHPSFVEVLFAAGTLGAIFVPVNTRLAGPEVEHVLADSGASLLLHADEHASTVAGTRTPPQLRTVALGEYEQLLTDTPADPIDEPVELEDPALILYTSGTTGRPKGAVLSHGNLTWNSINMVVDADFVGDDVALVVAPLFHAAALANNVLPTMLKGGTAVLVPTFDAEVVLELIERHRITFLHGVPTIYQALAASPRWPRTDLSSVRRASCGAAPVPAKTIQTYLERGVRFSQGYGMTETGPGALYLAPEDGAERIGSVGLPHFFTDVRIVHGDGTDVRPGETGEVLVAGPNVMSGYWNRPQATDDALSSTGWFRSGDLATLADDGHVRIVDRLKDMIISGGENIYPAEIESVLLRCPGVAAAAVIGVPDARWGEVGRVIVEPAPGAHLTEDAVLAFLTGHLARFKVPKSAVLVEQLPRNATGKVIKPSLRTMHGA